MHSINDLSLGSVSIVNKKSREVSTYLRLLNVENLSDPAFAFHVIELFCLFSVFLCVVLSFLSTSSLNPFIIYEDISVGSL